MSNEISNSELSSYESTDKQYSLNKIIIIWILSVVPMPILAFVITPFLIPKIDLHPGIVYWMAIIVGMIWQFILSLLILKREGYKIKWSDIRKRMMYQKPINSKTGKSTYWLLLWVIPFIILSGALQMVNLPDIETMLFPFINSLPKYDMGALASPEFKGAWWLLGLFLVSSGLNYFLGEEFLYRGILLPKMNGVFGKWDWLANGVLFGFYHLHKPQMFISSALVSGFLFAFPSKRFQSNWMAVIIHGAEGLFIFVLVLGIILGLA